MGNVIITGASGFLGTHLCAKMLSLGHAVLGVDNLSGSTLENLDEVKENPNFSFVEADCGDTCAMRSVFKEFFKPDVVFHLAADATEGRSQFTPTSSGWNNYWINQVVLMNAIRVGVKRYCMTSSMSVYGDQKPPFDEVLPRAPVDVYGISKAAAEHTVEVLASVHGFEYVILRPHNVYGNYQNLADPYRNVVAIWMNCLMRGKPFYIYGDGNQRRAFSYVTDIIDAMARCYDEPKVNKEIVNLGAKQDYSLNELAALVLAEFGSQLQPIYVPDRPREVKYAYSTVEKSVRLLGYKETVTLAEGVSRMAAWAKKVGPKEPCYLASLEIGEQFAPVTWRERLI